MNPARPSRTAGTPIALSPDDPRLKRIRQALEPVVTRFTADPDNPWAIGHGLLVLGDKLRLPKGEEPIPFLYRRYAEHDANGWVVFPQSDGAIRVEPHTELMLKAITEADIAPNFEVIFDGKKSTIADHYRGALNRTVFNVEARKSSFAQPKEMPWALQAIAAWAPNGLTWTNDEGVETSLDLLTTMATEALKRDTRFMQDAMDANKPFHRQGQGIFTHTCGGAHMLQGTAHAVARGFGQPADRTAIEQQAQLMFYRYPVERKITVDAMRDMPKYRNKLLVQRLKFTGHFIETMHKLAAMEMFVPTDAQSKVLDEAITDLDSVVSGLDEAALFTNLPALRANDEQLYLDIVGDSAHALNGLNLATGQKLVRY